MINLSNKTFDDNKLFRYLSKSYSKKSTFYQPRQQQNDFNKSTNSSYFKLMPCKKRSQSTGMNNSLLKSQTIIQSIQKQRPGFLKYRKFSNKKQYSQPSDLSTTKSFHRYSFNFKTIYDYDYPYDPSKQFKQCSKLNDITQQNFGLRNVVKRLDNQNQFRYQTCDKESAPPEYQFNHTVDINKKTLNILQGKKSFDISSFFQTNNLKRFQSNKKKSLRSTILRRKANKTELKSLGNFKVTS